MVKHLESGWGDLRGHHQHGFTLVEMIVAVVIIGILATIAVPAYHSARSHADGAAVIADFNAVKNAAFDCYSATGRFPTHAGWGVIPNTMADYLPSDFEFSYKDAKYRWWSWRVPSGLAWRMTFHHLLIFQIQSPTPELITSVKGIYNGPYVYAGPTFVTIVLYV